MKINVRVIIALIALTASIAWKPILIFIIPGMLILFFPAFKKIDLMDLLAYICGLSICFWVCSFWYLKYISLNLMTFFILIASITVLTSIYFLFKCGPIKIQIIY